MNKIDDAFGYWFSGFTDGEGYFGIQKTNRNYPRSKYRCRFAIGLRNDDKQVLLKIHNILKMGSIWDGPVYNYDSNAQTQFIITSVRECAELVKIFEKYQLQAKKQRDFKIWKGAVAELQKPVDERNADLLEYYFLKIKQVRQYENQEQIVLPKIRKLQLTIEFE
ncbi:hypothetical protein LCGC14_2866860 [marine sediment metagenome]|uniref:Homing endonuclease LAGLIDADG domain-containing protein n=1 Tax=marine sediment metagenome TaxID=412755 RepID=A0A0F9AV81_9ZZZZ